MFPRCYRLEDHEGAALENFQALQRIVQFGTRDFPQAFGPSRGGNGISVESDISDRNLKKTNSIARRLSLAQLQWNLCAWGATETNGQSRSFAAAGCQSMEKMRVQRMSSTDAEKRKTKPARREKRSS